MTPVATASARVDRAVAALTFGKVVVGRTACSLVGWRLAPRRVLGCGSLRGVRDVATSRGRSCDVAHALDEATRVAR